MVSGAIQADGVPRLQMQTAKRLPVLMRGQAARQRLSCAASGVGGGCISRLLQNATQKTARLDTRSGEQHRSKGHPADAFAHLVGTRSYPAYAPRWPDALHLTRTRSACAHAPPSETHPLHSRVTPYAVPCVPAWHSAITLTPRHCTRVGPLFLSPRSQTPRRALSRSRTPVVYATRNTKGT